MVVEGWREMSNIEFEDFCAKLYGHYLESDEKCDDFLFKERRLSKAFSLVKHLEEAQAHADEVAFFQLIRGQLRRTKEKEEREEQEAHAGAVRDLVDRSVAAEGAVDIYEAAGIEKPDLSILDEDFLEEFKSKEYENLRVKLFEKLLRDEIRVRRRKNITKYDSMKELLERTLERYRKGTLTAAEVIRAMVELKEEMEEKDDRQEETGLSGEELAFLDAIDGLGEEAYDMPFLCNLVHDIVQTVKRNLEVDWTKSHRENVKASVKAAIKRELRRHGVKKEHFRFIQRRVMEQAEEMYRDWPKSA